MVSAELGAEVVRALRGEEGHEVWELAFRVPAADAASACVTCEACVGPFARHVNGNAFLLGEEPVGPDDVTLRVLAVLREPVSKLEVRRVTLRAGSTRRSVSITRALRASSMSDYYKLIQNADADPTYDHWFEDQRRSPDELAAQRAACGPDDTLLSLVTPVFRTPPAFLEALLDAIADQTYQAWEHVLVNASPDDEEVSSILARRAAADPRVRVVTLQQNLGITGNTNAGIAAARGAYVGFLDHDDLVEPDCLFEYARTIRANPGCDLLYCDEDYVDAEGRFPSNPVLKPGMSPDLLRSNAYVLHLLMVSRSALDATERTTNRHEGAQDYDLALKVFELGGQVCHVPRVLYHWRLHERSMSANVDDKPYAQEAGRLAIEDHLGRLGLGGTITLGETPSSYETRLDPTEPAIRVRVVVPVTGSELPLPACDPSTGALPDTSAPRDASAAPSLPVLGFLEQEGVEVELVFVSEPDLGVAGLPSDPRVRLVQASKGASYVELLNAGLAGVTCPAMLLASPSLAPTSPTDLASMASLLRLEGTDVVAPRVITGAGLLVSSGLTVRPDGTVGRLNRDLPSWDGGYLFLARRSHDMQAAPALGTLVRTGALAGTALPSDYRDPDHAMADLGLQIQSRRHLCAFTPFVELSCSTSDPGASVCASCADDAAMLASRWGTLMGAGDPFYDANLDPWSDYYRLRAT